MLHKVYFLVMIIQSILPTGNIEKIYLDLDPIPYASWESCNNEIKVNIDKHDPTGKLRENKNNSISCVEREVRIVNSDRQKIHP